MTDSSPTYLDWEHYRCHKLRIVDPSQFGAWENPNGSQLAILPIETEHAGKQIDEYTADPVAPLTYLDTNGERWRCDNHFQTDGGSIPIFLRKHHPEWAKNICSAWGKFRRSFFNHDSGYRYKGLWRQNPQGKWYLQPMKRYQVDYRLLLMVGCDGGTFGERWTIYTMVTCFGWASWGAGDWRSRQTREITIEEMKHDGTKQDEC
jgi:hypothetical protein